MGEHPPISIDAQIAFIEEELRSAKWALGPGAAEACVNLNAVLDTLRGVKAAEDRAAGALATLRKLQEAER